MSEGNDRLSELEELDVIEARELNVGNSFHAFRFKAVEPVDEVTRSLIDKAAATLGMTYEQFSEMVDNEAVEDNPHANFARGVLSSVRTLAALQLKLRE
ncbi:hypothetical protein [Pleurocapsa sp. PCC 7319]|uniref:hypothetical protein n=1 Tax=Pleurocapsa sp. PCC 7319 TaxID=118161 RepID=UPI000348DCFA|nr:hypothetical protein [Pleurocapsa sp. PCC 7319]